MDKSESFSESTYAFAFTHELLRWVGTSLQAAPVFPSTREEGQDGVGYDVMLDRPGIPLFIQFKLSRCLVQRNAREFKKAKGAIEVPYYRINLTPASRSKQHQMLIELANLGNEVRYAAPKFHTRRELDAHFRNHTLLSHSLYVKSLAIGPLPDDKPHYYAFDAAGNHFFCSDPKKLDTNNEYEVFLNDLERRVQETSQDSRQVALALQGPLNELAIANIPPTEPKAKAAELVEYFDQLRIEVGPKREVHPLEFLAFSVNQLSEAQLFWVTLKE